MRLIAIDPGAKNLGVAYFENSVLWRAWLHPTAERFGLANICPQVVVIEKMQVFVGRSVAKDLIDLSIISGEIAGAMFNAYGTRAYYYTGATWGGQTPKEVKNARVIQTLEKQGTLSCVEIPRAKSLAHNVWDAVGLGLYHLNLTKRK